MKKLWHEKCRKPVQGHRAISAWLITIWMETVLADYIWGIILNVFRVLSHVTAVWVYGTSTVMNSHFTDGEIVAVSHFPEVCCCSVPTSCLTLCNSMDSSAPGSSVHGVSRQEYWSGLPCPPPGDLPDPGIKPTSPALQVDSLPLSYQWSPPWGCTANDWRNLLTSVGPQPLFWVFWLRDGKWNWPHTDVAGDVPASLMLATIQFVSRSSDGSLCFCVDFTHSSV